MVFIFIPVVVIWIQLVPFLSNVSNSTTEEKVNLDLHLNALNLGIYLIEYPIWIYVRRKKNKVKLEHGNK